MINYKEILMTDIIHDYAEIAKALKGDNWWRVKPTETLVRIDPKNDPAIKVLPAPKAISPLDYLRYSCPLCGHYEEIPCQTPSPQALHLPTLSRFGRMTSISTPKCPLLTNPASWPSPSAKGD
jgi:hypothetical protein